MIHLTIRVWCLLGGLLHLAAGMFALLLWAAVWDIGDHKNNVTAGVDLGLGVVAIWLLREGAIITWGAFR